MARLVDWNGREIEVATSVGGVIVTASPFDNLVRTGIKPWPPPEIIQKLYQSRQVRAFRDGELSIVKSILGFYSDLQSVHSEDAITWSIFGPLVYATPNVRNRFVSALLKVIDVSAEPVSNSRVWLWRRLPHPETLVSGGPEIDFGIQTEKVYLLGEAKWRSSVGRGQGILHNKDQITLRRDFCVSYGRLLLTNCRHFVILGLGLTDDMIPTADTPAEGVEIHSRSLTWEDVAKIEGHPLADEILAYIAWKRRHSHKADKGA